MGMFAYWWDSLITCRALNHLGLILVYLRQSPELARVGLLVA